uniref:Mutator family transposase n=2 Tax=Candidatus Kentrum eta TaxID=2126337 RepID=A0A450VR48_9GAMM|nr:MAG: Transposase, Mutator family [Candidatus Kentron sp. H]
MATYVKHQQPLEILCHLEVCRKVGSMHKAELYGLSVSNATISAVTDKLIPELKQWQQRPLGSHHPFLRLEAIHYKVKTDGRYEEKAVYTVPGLNPVGK